MVFFLWLPTKSCALATFSPCTKQKQKRKRPKHSKPNFPQKKKTINSDLRSVEHREKAKKYQTQSYIGSSLPLRLRPVLGKTPGSINFSQITSINATITFWFYKSSSTPSLINNHYSLSYQVSTGSKQIRKDTNQCVLLFKFLSETKTRIVL